MASKTSSFQRVNVTLVLVVIFLLVGFFLINMWSSGMFNKLGREGLSPSNAAGVRGKRIRAPINTVSTSVNNRRPLSTEKPADMSRPEYVER